MWEEEPGEAGVGRCAVCGCEIRIALAVMELGSAAAIRAARAATDRHMRSHTPGERARAELRTVLSRLSPTQRRVLVKDIYSELLGEWGECERRGVYSIDEALNCASLHRFWQDVSNCACPTCRGRQ
jgi:hypothetical protein